MLQRRQLASYIELCIPVRHKAAHTIIIFKLDFTRMYVSEPLSYYKTVNNSDSEAEIVNYCEA